jgi:hypothetical protein
MIPVAETDLHKRLMIINLTPNFDRVDNTLEKNGWKNPRIFTELSLLSAVVVSISSLCIKIMSSNNCSIIIM